VMSMKYLGKTIDIHGGGIENQFPHHECEIAQSEAANGVQFVRYWLHNNMVTVNGQKMGKSLNNFILLKVLFSGAHELLSRKYDPLAVRQLILQSHYRSPIDFSDAALTAAQSGFDKIIEAVIAVRKKMEEAPEGKFDDTVAGELKKLTAKFEEAMNDDLNTAVGLSVMFDLVRLANKLLEKKNTTRQTLEALDEKFSKLGGEVLGIVKGIYPEAMDASHVSEKLKKYIQKKIEIRSRARQEKDFELADGTRADLSDLGIVLEDEPGGKTTWRWE